MSNDRMTAKEIHERLEAEGGTAYPTNYYDELGSPIAQDYGMSMRDWFAGQALAQLADGTATAADTARWAYDYAEAMLEHRRETRPFPVLSSSDAWIAQVDARVLTGLVMKLTGGSANPAVIEGQIRNAVDRWTEGEP